MKQPFARFATGRWWVVALCTALVVVVGGVGISKAQESGSPSVFVPVAPVRVVDTRSGLGGPTMTAGSTLVVPIGGVGSVPADATAVMFNLTAVDGTAPSYLTAWPTGDPRPEASNLNWRDGWPEPNLATVMLGAGGSVSLYNFTGSVDVIVDLAGYYIAATGSTGTPGPPGEEGPPGAIGPAGAFQLVDAAGDVIPGTILSLLPDIGGGGGAFLAIVADDNGYAMVWDMPTGRPATGRAQQVFEFAGCTGVMYWDTATGTSLTPSILFTDEQASNPGDPLYRVGDLVPGFDAQSRIDTSTGLCVDGSTGPATVVTAVPYGTFPDPRPAPLAFVKTG